MNNKLNDIPDESDLDYEFAELDTTWINEFEALEKDYNSYYKEDLTFICINYVYVNNKNEIINISKEKYLFKKPGLLSRDELVGIIKHNTMHNSVKYSLLSLLKYNIDGKCKSKMLSIFFVMIISHSIIQILLYLIKLYANIKLQVLSVLNRVYCDVKFFIFRKGFDLFCLLLREF